MSDGRGLRPGTPVARHGRLRVPNPAAAVAKFIAVALCVVLVSGVSLAAIVYGSLNNNVQARQFVLPDKKSDIPTIGAYSGAVNLLLVGDDTRTGQKGHYGSDPGSALNDVNILLHISDDHTKAYVVSFPRDTYVSVPACTDPKNPGQMLQPESNVKLNSILSYGGIGCIRDTIANLSGIKIPYVAMITFDGVVEMSNAVGGVPVCVASPINDDYTELHLTKGEHTLQGATALKFLRTRHGVGDGSDLTRISSQQVFLSSLVRKLKQRSTLTDLTKLYGIASTASTSMTLSSSIANVDTMVSIGRALAPIDLDKVVFVQYPTAVQGDGVVPNTDAADTLMQAIKQDKTLKLSNAPKGDAVGSTADSSTSPSGSTSPSPSPSSSGKSSTVTLPSGVLGQPASESSCSVGNALGRR